MRIITIKEALSRAGEQITGIHGTVTNVYDRRSGTGQYGEWSFQDAMIKDATGQIRVCFAQQPDIKNRKGMKVTITAGEGKKGAEGLWVEEESYTDKKGEDKKAIKVKMNAKAFVDFGTTPVSNSDPVPPDHNGSEPDPSEAVDDEELAAQKALEEARRKKAERLKAEAEAKAKAASQAQSDAKGPSNYGEAKRRIVQITNLYDYAMRAAKSVLVKHGLELTDIYTATATCFIAMRDDGLTDAMPAALIRDGQQEDQQPPAKPVDPVAQPDLPDEAYDQEPQSWRDVKYNGTPLGDTAPKLIELLFNTFKPKVDPATGNYKMEDLYLKNALLEWRKETM